MLPSGSIIWRKKAQGFDAATCGLIQTNPVMALPMRHVCRAVARDYRAKERCRSRLAVHF
ncbi:hypothetical protein DDT54_16680 [Brenneria nigrifluens DSM 30175 = ATCC 13028]|uniref:Uncharacterized protein n=1 Tax=Brenneria nigrifluens DSM 30175 = ATCC 13028 TaxID=1121120 RepID=A0A2U1ULR2_9GAMM|nr:hypothetical protein DDT54_16680 [Brenneria nigrifluens DSM 30175 = ATCC 13028]